MAFLKGYAIGLAMVAFIGPVVFTLLKASLEKGTRAGLSVATGIVVSDILVVLICLAGAIPFFENENNQFWIALLGSVLLLLLGMKYLSPMDEKVKAKISKKNETAASFTNGFLVNLINPFVFMVWIGLIVIAQGNYGTGRSLWIFLFAILLGIYTQDIAKVFLAKKIKPFLDPKKLFRIYQILGLLMLAFAIRLFLFALSIH